MGRFYTWTIKKMQCFHTNRKTWNPMPTQSFQCPSCGAPLTSKGNAPVMSCPYCHTSVIVPEGLRQGSGDAAWPILLFDNFTSNDNGWLAGNHPNDYFAKLNQTIADGRYRWEARVNIASTITTAWLDGYQVSDTHLITTCKHISGSKAGSSCGVIFRIQDNHNFY